MMDVGSDSAQPGRADSLTSMADYYAILSIKPGFSDLKLLGRFLRSCKLAMATGDQTSLIEIRRGFEVLRYEDTRIVYFRMHRVLVRNEPLRFPEAKKREMLQEIRAKEAIALHGTSPVIAPTMDFGTLLFNVVAGIVLMDLARLIPWGGSGVLLLVALPIIIASNGFTWVTMGIGALFVGLAFLALKARASDYVTYPGAVPFRFVTRKRGVP